MRTLLNSIFFVIAVTVSAPLARAGVDADVQKKLDAALGQMKTWAADATLVAAVKNYNTAPPADAASMTQDKWKSLAVLDPFVRSMTKNDAAGVLKTRKTEAVTEAFVSGANGTKVAFLNKPSGWSHAGKAKHDKPMANASWQGDVEVDDSTGQQQIQLAVPILDGDKPIGSLVVGFAVSKL